MKPELLGTSPAPHWPNHCDHNKREFVKSFHLDGGYYDIYVFGNRGPKHLCVRYGSEESQYYSPGPVTPFLKSTTGQAIYHMTKKILLSHGYLDWVRNEWEN